MRPLYPGETGTWKKDNLGWWYERNDKSFPKFTWCFISNAWYYFNNDGYMKTGWLSLDNSWYYLSEEGKMQTGWTDIDGSRWYFNQVVNYAKPILIAFTTKL